MIQELRIHALRNIKQVSLALGQYNLFVGKNGSGKTSLLEAVFLLSRGKSFRHHEPKRYIMHHEKTCIIWAKTYDQTFAIQKQLDMANLATTTLKLNNSNASSQSVLSFLLPTLLIDPTSMAVLEEGSGVRRQLLDWLSFHVEHDFYPQWLSYQRLLRQRNSLLKSASFSVHEIGVWDRQLAIHAKALHHYRMAIFNEWQVVFDEMVMKLLPDYKGKITLNYNAGFDTQMGLFEVLQNRLLQDKELGYTRVGAHRADIVVSLKYASDNGDKIKEQAVNVLSRGEKKLLITALKFSQLQMLCRRLPNIEPVVLIDDLDAELDDWAIDILLDVLFLLPCQLFITSLQNDTIYKIRQKILNFYKNNDDLKVFHVEQGRVCEIF